MTLPNWSFIVEVNVLVLELIWGIILDVDVWFRQACVFFVLGEYMNDWSTDFIKQTTLNCVLWSRQSMKGMHHA